MRRRSGEDGNGERGERREQKKRGADVEAVRLSNGILPEYMIVGEQLLTTAAARRGRNRRGGGICHCNLTQRVGMLRKPGLLVVGFFCGYMYVQVHMPVPSA